jgi:hypothetical protein
LSEHFTELSVLKLTEPASVQYKQIAVLGVRLKRYQLLRDSALLDSVRWLEMLTSKSDLEALGDAPAVRYQVPDSGPVTLTNVGIPLDEVEDLLPDSAAYRQASRVLLPKQQDIRGRPLTPLHGGHVGLLFRNAQWSIRRRGSPSHCSLALGEVYRSLGRTREDGTKILHDRERFSHELTLIFADGETKLLTHEKKDSP